MGTITTNFTEVKIHAHKSGKCVTCGKRRKRVKKFWQTLSPYNKKANGTIKTAFDIRKEEYAKALAWESVPIDCCNES